MNVIPAPGRTVADPFLGDNLPPEGREVEANQYWLRRIDDGDVIEGIKPKVKGASNAKPD